MADVTPDRSGQLEIDGHTLYWEYFGNGSREAVCLLNGLAMHTPAWYGFLPRLRPDYDVLLWDYPGQGRSSSNDVEIRIDSLAGYLDAILTEARVERIHAMGISWGGFVALEFARLFQQRLHTLTVSGILLSRERLFEMYQALSLRFYRGSPEAFETYTHYMYEKIFGEEFSRSAWESLESMRAKFHDRYASRVHSLIRLTEAQNPFFESLAANMDAYRAIRTPSLVIAGEDDRCIPPKAQKKILSILPDARWEQIPDSGHVAYLEKPDVFFPLLRRFIAAKSTRF